MSVTAEQASIRAWGELMAWSELPPLLPRVLAEAIWSISYRTQQWDQAVELQAQGYGLVLTPEAAIRGFM